MARIFGRDAAPDHALETGLGSLESVPSSERFIAHNWRHDWRVSEHREAQALRGITAPQTSTELRAWYREYYRGCVCQGSPPEYLDVYNHSNFGVGFAGDYSLAHALRLNAFWPAAQEAFAEVRGAGPAEWGPWLDQSVQNARRLGFLGVRDLLADLFRAWNKWSKLDQRPFFAAAWSDVGPLLASGDWPDRLRDALGMGHVEAGEWLAVIRYQVQEVRPCVRPTSLDADWKPWHFPSPPGERTGLAMDLATGTGGLCCREVIHHPRELKIEQWTGHLGRTTESPAARPVDDLRRRHHQRLRKRLGNDVVAWMPSPV